MVARRSWKMSGSSSFRHCGRPESTCCLVPADRAGSCIRFGRRWGEHRTDVGRKGDRLSTSLSTNWCLESPREGLVRHCRRRSYLNVTSALTCRFTRNAQVWGSTPQGGSRSERCKLILKPVRDAIHDANRLLWSCHDPLSQAVEAQPRHHRRAAQWITAGACVRRDRPRLRTAPLQCHDKRAHARQC
jgi:hypothetical protein